ncbi:glycosyltransferase [Patescibacteria group bacterium]
MAKHNIHVFTAELPYEDDQPVTQYLKNNFTEAESYVMGLGQMSRIPPSKLLSYRNGKLRKQTVYVENNLKSSGLKLYFYTIPLSLIHVVVDFIRAIKTINNTCDIFFAQHFLPAFLAVLFRKIGLLKTKKIVFWMFDFFLIPPQFPRSIYYRGMDLIHGYVRKHTDEMWFTTPRLMECDFERYGSLPNNTVTRLTEGVFFKKIKTKRSSLKNTMKLAFLGSLRPNNSVYESLDAVIYSTAKGLSVELHIIGSGPEEERMKIYVKKNNAEKYVIFYGFENRGEEIAKILSICHLGLSLYNSDPYGPNWFLTSGKFRRFVSQGLPIITTTVPYYAKYVHDFRAGMIVDNNKVGVYKAVKNIIDNPTLLKEMQKGVDKLYRKYEGEKVLDKNFKLLVKALS